MINLLISALLTSQVNSALIRRTDAASDTTGSSYSIIPYGLGLPGPSPTSTYVLSASTAIATDKHNSNGNYVPLSTPAAASSGASAQDGSSQTDVGLEHGGEDDGDHDESGPEGSDAPTPMPTPSLSPSRSVALSPNSARAAQSLEYDDGSWSPTKYDRGAAPVASSALLQYGDGMPGPMPSPSGAASAAMSSHVKTKTCKSFGPGGSNISSNRATASNYNPNTPSSTPASPSAALPSSSVVKSSDPASASAAAPATSSSRPAASTLVIPTFFYSSIRPVSTPAPPSPVTITLSLFRGTTTAPSGYIESVRIISLTITNKVAMSTALAARDWNAEIGSEVFGKRAVSTLTLKTTIVTNTLSTSVSRSRASASSNVDRSKSSIAPSSKKTMSSTKPSATASTGPTVSVVVDPRCPYPYPGVNCTGQDTTLVTRTSRKAGEMSAETKPTSTSWCPYPGQVC